MKIENLMYELNDISLSLKELNINMNNSILNNAILSIENLIDTLDEESIEV